jgi:septal ring factor EnvC (AmiA/AmiB activator)
MERNRWDTAIRCLEVALHPNTSDDEVIAGVNGFRRTADGTPLSQVCIEFAGRDYDGCGPIADSARWHEKLDRLNQENLDLRRTLEVEEGRRISTVRRLQEAERRVRDLSNELLAAQRRASEIERQFADFRSAYGQILDGANREEFEQASRTAADRQIQRAAPPFRKFLAAARQRADQAETAITHHATALSRGRESSGSPILGSSPRPPWTA